jgi:hypothetical protein
MAMADVLADGSRLVAVAQRSPSQATGTLIRVADAMGADAGCWPEQ